ncbi:MAG: hypothetical protein ACKVS6_15990 [Planctomycetota bacterium]
MKRLAVAMIALAAIEVSVAGAQIADQIVIFQHDSTNQIKQLGRFDRTLLWLGSSDFPSGSLSYDSDATSIALNGQGKYWIPWDALAHTEGLVMLPNGVFLPNVILSHYPTDATAAPNGDTLFITRIPLLLPGPLYSFRSGGTLRWMSWNAVSLINNGFPPASVAASALGDIYLGGVTKGACACNPPQAVVVVIDPKNGLMKTSITFPSAGTGNSFFREVAGASDGGMWAYVQGAGAMGPRYYKINGTTIVKDFLAQGGHNGGASIPCYDAYDNIYGVQFYSPPTTLGDRIRKMSPVDGSIVQEFSLGRVIIGLALGAGGEEIFAMTGLASGVRFLDRVNLITGVHSSIQLDPTLVEAAFPGGDPTGYIYANVINRAGDSDGDGVSNGNETLAYTNPYDATSVPWGPRVYLYWNANNTLKLKYTDPDGLLSPTGGLAALDIQAEGYGDVTGFFLQYVTSAIFSKDAKELTVEFGGFSIPNDLKIRITARAQDATGAIGSDWAVTPPGIL